MASESVFKAGAEETGPFNPRFQQTMLRIKDPKVSLPFYEKHFGMKLVHWYDFPQWTFSVYFLELQPEGFSSPEPGTPESEVYLNNMKGTTIELTHNHGSENDDSFVAWNGNTGADGSGANHAAEPKYRGFGHIAFNTDDVYKSSDKLEAAGVKFQKKPDEGNMKGLAFALDPDGYWIEIVKRLEGIFPQEYNLSQTMLRVKDGPKSLAFYRDVLGMTVVKQLHFEKWKFSLFFLASMTESEVAEAFSRLPEDERKAHGDKFNPELPSSMTKVMWQSCLELTWNHGTENDDALKVHDGNSDPRGFGHIGYLVDDLDACCARMENDFGTKFKKKPSEGNMHSIAFAYDPDGYWIELIGRGATFQGVAANLPAAKA